ncbi:MAG: DUF2007 domain-containing protein [Opitutaceae bacterium]
MIIATYSKPEEAHLAASLLRGNGIEAYIRDEHMVNMHWLYSNAIGGVKLEIAEEDYADAQEVLNLPKETEGALLLCPHCESSNVHMRELSLLSGICLALYLPLPFACRKVDCLDCGKEFTHK